MEKLLGIATKLNELNTSPQTGINMAVLAYATYLSVSKTVEAVKYISDNNIIGKYKTSILEKLRPQWQKKLMVHPLYKMLHVHMKTSRDETFQYKILDHNRGDIKVGFSANEDKFKTDSDENLKEYYSNTLNELTEEEENELRKKEMDSGKVKTKGIIKVLPIIREDGKDTSDVWTSAVDRYVSHEAMADEYDEITLHNYLHNEAKTAEPVSPPLTISC
jgi:hypothetical protein